MFFLSKLCFSSNTIAFEFTNALYLGTSGNATEVTSSASELNLLDGVTATTTELNYTDGVTSSIQTQIDGKLASNGTAATATALATARTIGGVSFDGTANINLPGVNTAGDQNTTGNAATATKIASITNIGSRR